jgi:SulP family sulfate permease
MRGQEALLQLWMEARVAEARASLARLFSTATGDLVGGLSSSVVGVAYGLTFANLIFSGPLKPWSGYGLAATFITMTICAAFMAMRSSLPFVIAGPDGATAAITASLVSALLATLDEIGPPDDLLAPTMILIALSTAMTGIILWAIGTLRASNAIRYIPYPVIGGFLAATGWLMINGGIRIVLGRAAGVWMLAETHGPAPMKLFAAVGMALLITLLQRFWKSPHAVPVAVLGGVLAGHAVLLAMDVSLLSAQSEGWFVRPPRSDGLAATFDLNDLKMFPWGSLPALSGDILGMVFVTAVTMLLNTNGVEFVTHRDVDLGHELKAMGAANLLSAVFGGYVGCTSLSRTTLNHAVGGAGRLSGLIVALISGVALLTGSGFAGFAPKFVLGGLMLNLGGVMLRKWLIDSARLISRQDYVVLLMVAFAILKWGFIAGVLAGVLIGCVTFAYGASRTEAVKFSFDGAEYGSSLDRARDELDILVEQREEIQGFILQSYLFFGSANRLYEQVKALLAQREACRFLIFDFRLVNGLDSSALHSFRQIKQIATARGVSLVLVDLPAALHGQFDQIVDANDIVCDSLDHALEACENDVISRHLQSSGEATGLVLWLTDALGCPRLAERLAGVCERQDVCVGEILAIQGAPADSMHFIVEGRLAIMVALDTGAQTRVRSLGPHTTVGEMGLLTGGLRSATVLAEADSIVYRLDVSAFQSMKQNDPELSQALLTYVVGVLAQRLRMTSNMVAVLRR